MIGASGWLAVGDTKVSAYPGCVVMIDPHSDRKCGAPASGGRTVLDLPLCDECHSYMAAL